MNKCKKIIVGEAYLFQSDKNLAIIGIFDKFQEGFIIHESLTCVKNFQEFQHHKTLPPNYRPWRRTFRKELWDYRYNLAVFLIL